MSKQYGMTLKEAINEIRRRDEILESNNWINAELRLALHKLDDCQDIISGYRKVPQWLVSFCNRWL